MTWFKEAGVPKEDQVTFSVSVTKQFADGFEELLKDLKSTAGMGHTFNIVVDPDADGGRKFEMDGDGSEHIVEIKRANEKEANIFDFPDYNRTDQMKGDSGLFSEDAPVDRKKKIAPDPGPASLNPGMADISPQVFE